LTSTLGVKWHGRDDHSLPSSAEAKKAQTYTSTLPYIFMAQYLVKHG